MKILSAALTAPVALGFAGAATAQCAGYDKTAAETAEAPIVVAPPPRLLTRRPGRTAASGASVRASRHARRA